MTTFVGQYNNSAIYPVSLAYIWCTTLGHQKQSTEKYYKWKNRQKIIIEAIYSKTGKIKIQEKGTHNRTT